MEKHNDASFTYAGPEPKPEKEEEPPFALGSMAGGSATEDRILARRAAERALREARQQTPLETGPFMTPAPDRARVIGTEPLADGFRRSGGGERTFTRSEVLTVLKALHAAGAGFPEYIAAFTKME